MTIQTTPPAESAVRTPENRWSSIHVYLRWAPEHVDAFLCAAVAPLMAGLVETGHIEDWFFIRYAERGPHLRIRLRPSVPATVAYVCERLGAQVSEAGHPESPDLPARDDWYPHGTVREAAYEPETDRYGGRAGLAVAEEVFCRSTQAALQVVARTAGRAARMAVAAELVLATAVALDLDALDTVRWLRRGAIAWRWHRDIAALAPPAVQGPALHAAASQAGAVARRFAALREAAGNKAWLSAQWTADVRAARTRLEADPDTSRERWLQVWSSQLHMLLNRLGLLPDEERSLGWFITSCLQAADGCTDFFADSTEARDRRYLEASSFAASRMSWQQPRDAERPPAQPRYNPYARPAVPLPARPLPQVGLSEALSARACGRGDLGGAVSAADLGTLLWPAYATISNPAQRNGRAHRPYPSAGAQYVARIRLIARTVRDLDPGLYELDPEGRRLMPLSALPDDDELAESSMWFGRQPPEAGRVDLAGLPALLGLYVELTAMRARYGLRALRFALLEAGHLAQNLTLVAAAAGLSVGLLGGFYDDVAHEIFLLDGVDDALAYLMPVGRPRSRH